MTRNLLSSLKSLPHSKVRCDIVNSKLCDDIIQHLKPSLAPFAGCTIIDINPGTGLFSQKLHDHLKPRSHILLEPHGARYEQHLKPLLEAPGSRYHLRDWPDEHCWEKTHFIREGLMPSLDGVGGPAPTSDVPNNLALIVGNMTNWGLIAPGRSKIVNYTSLKALDFARRVRHLTGVNDGAISRMLLWTADSDKYPMVPRTVDSRGRASAILEPVCHVEEIVGSDKARKVRREHALDARSMQRVAERTEGDSNLQQSCKGGIFEEKAAELSSTSREWHQRLRDLEDGFNAMKIPQFVGLPPGPLQTPSVRSRGSPERTPEYKHMLLLQRVLRGQNAEIEKVRDLLERQAKIDRLDNEAAQSETIDEDKQQSKYKEIDTLILELKEALRRLTKKELYRFMFLDDDRRAFEMTPPLLMWDRRTAEPLIAQKDDFFPPKELALLDFQQKPIPDLPATTLKQNMYYDMLATALMSHKTPINAKFLDHVGPGAYKALVERAPSLVNPLKGGRHDLESVRTRTMTPEMLCELAIAWDEWPFKPPLMDTSTRTDSALDGPLRDGGPVSRL